MFVRKPLDSTILCALLEPFACPALIVDVNRRIRAVNTGFRTRFPSKPDVLGARCHEVLHGRAHRCPRREHLCPLEACARTGTVVPAIHPHADAEGSREEHVLVRPILAEDGTVVACLATLRPIGSEPGRPDEHGDRTALVLAPVASRLGRYVRSRRPLLLVGERGTGKSTVARAIHRQGRPWDAWEERYGYELTPEEILGLWTAARKIGRGGTLYVRGIHNLALRAQDALVDVLRSDALPRCRWRLIACTDRELRFLTKMGFFRRELLACFGSRRLRLPPLRERRDELPELALRLLKEMGSPALAVTPAALERLRAYRFPGNIDELAQALRHASLMAPAGEVDAEHLPDWVEVQPRPGPSGGDGPLH
jgi:transcriptional regulator of aromatic amino acid metabolism